MELIWQVSCKGVVRRLVGVAYDVRLVVLEEAILNSATLLLNHVVRVNVSGCRGIFFISCLSRFSNIADGRLLIFT